MFVVCDSLSRPQDGDDDDDNGDDNDKGWRENFVCWLNRHKTAINVGKAQLSGNEGVSLNYKRRELTFFCFSKQISRFNKQLFSNFWATFDKVPATCAKRQAGTEALIIPRNNVKQGRGGFQICQC